ncbi:unnamed protein product [Linum tenue]|uniref:Uncharacterized protein n=1 Tax=Linum tenue TaxID=586396 RepID=A0AAV0RLK9_9ROSI|nr:unnamed protein product [Linum tenue]
MEALHNDPGRRDQDPNPNAPHYPQHGLHEHLPGPTPDLHDPTKPDHGPKLLGLPNPGVSVRHLRGRRHVHVGRVAGILLFGELRRDEGAQHGNLVDVAGVRVLSEHGGGGGGE